MEVGVFFVFTARLYGIYHRLENNKVCDPLIEIRGLLQEVRDILKEDEYK